MFISKRFIMLALAGVLPAVLSFVPGVGIYAFLIYNLLLFIFLFADFSISPEPEAFHIKRVVERKLSLSVWNRIDLIIENPIHSLLKIHVRDAVPDSFISENEIISFELGGEEIKTISYRVKPVKRGEYVFPWEQ